MTLVDWMFRSLSVALVAFGCVALIHGLWGDRLRGLTKKRRCPKCWYDLSGAVSREGAAWLCTECGHVEAAETNLHRGRKKWWALAAAPILVAAGAVSWLWPTINRDGWRATVPTWILVRQWPIDEVAWMEQRGGYGYEMLYELDRRIDTHQVPDDLLQEWAARVQRAYARESGTGPQTPDTRQELVILDLSGILQRAHPDSDGSENKPGDSPMAAAAPTSDEHIEPDGVSRLKWTLLDHLDSVRGLLLRFVERDAWSDNGGREAYERALGNTIVVAASPEIVKQSQSLVGCIERMLTKAAEGAPIRSEVVLSGKGWNLVVHDVGDIRSHRSGPDAWASDRALSVRDRILENVDVDTWVDNGGASGQMSWYQQLLFVQASPDTQAKIDAYLATLRAEQAR